MLEFHKVKTFCNFHLPYKIKALCLLLIHSDKFPLSLMKKIKNLMNSKKVNLNLNNYHIFWKLIKQKMSYILLKMAVLKVDILKEMKENR